MRTKNNPNQQVIWLYFLLAAFSFPHLIDDFLFDIPAEFGLSNQVTQILSSIFLVIFMLILRALVLGKKAGTYAALGMGIFLALAGILKHIPLIIKPGPYWSGWFSEGLIFGMIFSGIALAVSASFSLQRGRKIPRED